MNLQGSDMGDLVRCFAALSPQGERLERRLAELLCPELLGTDTRTSLGRMTADKTRSGPPNSKPVVLPASFDGRNKISIQLDRRHSWPEGAGADEPILATDLLRLDDVGGPVESKANPFEATFSIATLVPVEPLFEPRNARALLVALAGTSRSVGPIDVEKIVELLARGQSLLELPRKKVHSLYAGVEVLADLGGAMQPLRADQEDVIARLVHVVGKSRVTIRYFEGCPTRGIESAEGGLLAYKAPNRGTPVLLLSDFGVARSSVGGERAQPAEWAALAKTIARAGCSAIGLSPYPALKMPRALTRLFPILHWDRRTTAGAARRMVARGGGS